MDKVYRQLELRSDNTYLVCCIEEDSRLYAGRTITLKEIPYVAWTIIWISQGTITSPRRTWHVGGL